MNQGLRQERQEDVEQWQKQIAYHKTLAVASDKDHTMTALTRPRFLRVNEPRRLIEKDYCLSFHAPEALISWQRHFSQWGGAVQQFSILKSS